MNATDKTPGDKTGNGETGPTEMTELERWRDELAQALSLDNAELADIEVLLDIARDAAHAVTRPAAPLTTFLVGYALAQNGGSAVELRELSAIATKLAATWQPGTE